jgi:hypothetical protein
MHDIEIVRERSPTVSPDPALKPIDKVHLLQLFALTVLSNTV